MLKMEEQSNWGIKGRKCAGGSRRRGRLFGSGSGSLNKLNCVRRGSFRNLKLLRRRRGSFETYSVSEVKTAKKVEIKVKNINKC